jgi:selenoprotein W-related protein
MGQELLSTFGNEIGELCLQPGAGGIFEIWANDSRLWSRKEDGGFPEIAELKRRVRDVIVPERDLGCIDRQASSK